MKKLFVVVLLLATACASAGAAGCNSLGPWTRLSDSPHLGTEGSTVVYDGKLYCLGGFTDAGLTATETVSVFDPSADQWTSAAPMPSAALTHFQAESDGQYIYVVGGFQGDYPGPPISAAHRYDLAADRWSSLPDLPEARAGGALALIQTASTGNPFSSSSNEVHLWYLSGLIDYHNDSAKIFKLRVGDAQWIQASESFPDPKNHFLVRLIGDMLYAPGGQHHYEPGGVDVAGFVGGVVNFESNSAEWKSLVPLPAERSHAETLVVSDRLVLFGGRNNQATKQIYDDIIEYDPFANQWNVIGQLPVQLISPFGGFVRNVSVKGVVGDYVIITKGGLDWNLPLNGTYAARVTSTCSPIVTTKPAISIDPTTTQQQQPQQQTTTQSNTPNMSPTTLSASSSPAPPPSSSSSTTTTADTTQQQQHQTQQQNEQTSTAAALTAVPRNNSALSLQESFQLLTLAAAVCLIIALW